MKNLKDPRVLGGWLVASSALVIYTLTMAPTVAFWDVGEFIATSATLSVPHPPGAPTFVLLGRLFTLLPLPLNTAASVNFISVVGSALAALFLYLIILEMLHLWEEDQHWSGYSPVVQAVAAGVGALAYAFSSSAWFNSVEAEVYGLSMGVTALCLWLALRHIHWAKQRPGSISLLLLMAYVLGLGAGNHLLALLTVPSVFILLWYLDRPTLTRKDLWVGAIVLFVAGYSVYILLYLRSGLNPPIDMNNPETPHNFMQFLQRRQYGSESMIATMFDRKAPLSWQIDYQFLRYYRDQFLPVFYLIAFVGALVNLYRDKRTFFANAALWLIMGFGLVAYLNMPDPQPRDRDYIFVGCYFATAIWIGMGMAGITAYARDLLKRVTSQASHRAAARTAALVIGLAGAGLVVWQTASLYHSHDRTGDYIPWDYGYNILQSCEPNSILFTNGDNDTYPLWYLQIIEGIRPDVRVVNLSLLNTDWYIKELRDREPRVPIQFNDRQIATQLGLARVGQDTTFDIAGMPWRLRRGQFLRVQDIMIAHILQANRWQRPAYFAITVPEENQANLVAETRLEGFAFRIGPGLEAVAVDKTLHNLREVFQYRGVMDPAVHKDENAENLLINYSVVVMQTAQALIRQGRREEAWDLLQWAEETVPTERPQAQWFYGLGAQAVGEYERSTEYLRRALEDPTTPRELISQIYALLIYGNAQAGEFEAAVAAVEEWLMLAPRDSATRAWLDDLRGGRVPESLRDLGTQYYP